MRPAFAQHHHLIGNDLGAVVALAFCIFPAARLKPAFDIDLLPAREVLLADFGQTAPRNHIEPFRLVMLRTIPYVLSGRGAY